MAEQHIRTEPLRIDIWHNILWSKYKGGVFSELHKEAVAGGVEIRFFQIAESEANRAGLAPIDMRYHTYPHELLFAKAYNAVPKVSLVRKILARTWQTEADLIVLAGYDRIEYWLQAFTLFIKGKRIAVFCDSTSRDNPRTSIKSILKRMFFAMCDGVFCYGQRSAQYVASFGVSADRIWHRCQAAALPFGYDPVAVMRQRLLKAPAEASPRYLYVGRLSAEKNIDVLLDAFAIVFKQYPQAVLSIVGTGPQEADLKVRADALGLQTCIIFGGSKFDDALQEEYLAATCLILPSRSEPWGLVVNEALSYGCPVIVSDSCGCVPELVVDGVTGFVFQTGDLADLAHRMEDALSFSWDIEKTIQNCLTQIEPFSPRRAAGQIYHGCMSLVSGKTPETRYAHYDDGGHTSFLPSKSRASIVSGATSSRSASDGKNLSLPKSRQEKA